jgi:hypothetical protein
MYLGRVNQNGQCKYPMNSTQSTNLQFELGSDDLQWVGFGFAVSAMLLILGFLLVFLRLTM